MLVPVSGAPPGTGPTTISGLSTHALAQLGQHPRSHTTPQPLSADATLSLSYVKVFRADELWLAVFAHNHSAAAVLNVSVSFVLPPSTSGHCHGEPGANTSPSTSTSSSTSTTVQVRAIQPHTTATQFLQLRFVRLAPQMHVTGRCVYTTVSNTTTSLGIAVPLAIVSVFISLS
jgi:hypothetical protein